MVFPSELTGERAKLVPLEQGHILGLFAAGQHPEIWRLLPSRMETLDNMTAIVRMALAARDAGTEYPFVVIDQVNNQIVGSTRYLDMSETHRTIEIGWTWLSPTVWRTRINSECKYLLLNYAFETLGMNRVCLKTDGRNTRSQAAIERIGAVREGTLRRHRIMPDGFVRDSVYFSIIADEWPTVKARLEGFLSSNAQR